ncbi:MAG: endonuclease/exonuclease/phosphatase family protein [Pyrinomonadaceae bacterium]
MPTVAHHQNETIVIASYNMRYAGGPHLISGGLLRKIGISNVKRRAHVVSCNISVAAKAFSTGALLPVPDVILLQEADKQTKRTGSHHVARTLAEGLQMNWIFVPAGIPRGIKPKQRQWWLDFEEAIELFDPGDTGVALLSRFQVSDILRIDLPWQECPWRPRLAMAATIPAAHGAIRLFNVHVDPHAGASGQLEQLETIVAFANESNGPVMIAGDFNTLSNQKCRETRGLLESQGYITPFATGTPTWRGAGIRLHADWIFGRGVEFVRWGVAKPLKVSDHWPIWAEVRV